MPNINQHFSQEISSHVTNRRKESFARIIKIIKQNPPKTLMDIGCASGNFLFQLADSDPQIQAVGIDKSTSLIKEALRRQRQRENPRFFYLDIISPKSRLKYKKLLKSNAEFITILGTLHTFHNFEPILNPLISNKITKTILIHSPFNNDPVNVRVFHQDLTSANRKFQSGYNIFSKDTVSQFLKKNRVRDFRFIPFVMKKTLFKDRKHPMFNYHLVDQNGNRWLTNGARLIFQEYFLLINLTTSS